MQGDAPKKTLNQKLWNSVIMTSEDEDEDMQDQQAKLEEAVNIGNINIVSKTNNKSDDDDNFNSQLLIMSREAEAAQAKHEQLLKSIEEKRLKQNLRVPTDDNEVKQRLRALKEPICFFGEDVCYLFHYLSPSFFVSIQINT